jgi:hypothetical protein
MRSPSALTTSILAGAMILALAPLLRAASFGESMSAFERARADEEVSIEKAREGYRNARHLARELRTNQAGERDRAAVLLVESEKRLDFLKDRDRELDAARKALVLALETNQLVAARKILTAAKVPSLDSRFSKLTRRLSKRESVAKTWVEKGDKALFYSAREAHKLYLKAQDVDVDMPGIQAKVTAAYYRGKGMPIAVPGGEDGKSDNRLQ